jgi:hypothetical protein
MKPYAWINVNDEYKIMFDDELPTHYPEAWMPLYANPIKELTDNEIVDISAEFLAPKNCNIYTFARAILRKAQE